MSFVPPSEKTFPHPEGSLLLNFNKKAGAWYITKILKIEKAEMRAGDVKNIAGQRILAPVDDFFLIVAVKWTDSVYASAEKAKESAGKNEFAWKYMHIPMRPTGLMAEPGELIGKQEVTREELEPYYEWKLLFDKGEAGVW